LRQAFLFEHFSQQIVLWVSEIVQPIKKIKCRQNRTDHSDGDTRITLFQL